MKMKRYVIQHSNGAAIADFDNLMCAVLEFGALYDDGILEYGDVLYDRLDKRVLYTYDDIWVRSQVR